MPERRLPRYPIYVLSKSRATTCLTARFLTRDAVPFRLVVEPAEADEYREANPAADLLVTDRDNLGATGVRNWIADHSTAEGADRHWQLDDNIREVRRLWRGERIPANSGPALRVCEDLTDRYTNVGVSGLNYQMFVTAETTAPYLVNVHVYSCALISNRMPYRWRLPLNDDTDLCLQVLAGGLCTLALNAFMADKMRTMTMPGGQGALYHGDGRLRMAKTLERRWPYVVSTRRRFKRPQHVVRDAWRSFDTPLERRPDLDWDALAGTTDEYGYDLVQTGDSIQSPVIRDLYEHWHRTAR